MSESPEETTTLTINVTKNDIKEGDVRKCRSCPVARAITRRLRKPYFASASVFKILIVDDDAPSSRSLSNVPRSVGAFITDFDRRRKVDPFSFEIEIPTEYLRR